MAALSCPACGSPCRPGDRFCSQCGERDPLRSVAQGATAGPTAALGFGRSDAETAPPAANAPPADAVLAPNSLFAGRYRIERLLGEGGMGRVYAANDTSIEERIALKVLLSRYSRDREMLEQFKRELKLARRVRQRNVVQGYDLGFAGELSYISMEFIDAENLTSFLARRGRLPEPDALRILGQVLKGLRAAHDLGIIHRDIKSANILINGDRVAFITDFGLATPSRLVPKLLGGTPVTMAPEQFLGQAVSEATDLYACGVLLHVMLAGRPPFPASGFEALRHAHLYSPPEPLPESVAGGSTRQLVAELLQKDAPARPQQAGEVLERVNAILAFEIMTVQTTSPIALVVDEDPWARAVCSEALERESFHVLEAADTRKAIALAFANEIAVVVMSSEIRGGLDLAHEADPVLSTVDPSLPGLDGLGLCRVLHSDGRLRTVPVVVTASRERSELREAFSLVGAAGIVTRPFGPDDIARGVRAARSRVLLERGAPRG